MKKCPFCAEDVQDQATKCKHCGEWLPMDKESGPSLLGRFISREKEKLALRKAEREAHDKASRPALRECKVCRRTKLTQMACFQENMSYFVARQERNFAGFVCFPCMSMSFAKFEIRTLLFTWWGIIGFFLGPAYLVGNLGEYLKLSYRFLKAKP